MPMVDVAEVVRALPFVSVAGAAGVASPLAVTLAFADGYRGQLAWERDGSGGLSSLTLTASLPAGDSEGKKTPRIRLSPQRGVIAAVGALSEVHLDVADVDAAFVIHADDPALLVAVVPELATLAPSAPSIVVDEKGLTVVFADLAASAVAGAVDGAFSLWHKALFFLMGTA